MRCDIFKSKPTCLKFDQQVRAFNVHLILKGLLASHFAIEIKKVDFYQVY